ncbi:uncharacterized protein LOC133362907 [Lethenteron reissneri]|uniref:uncharacterized protein LOC133362907 n=1 Tax=Lethenteron reissneri TaxID=7753 RepID=UPI002AB64F44|nr:uncharacterized protein LOC133362907 [Lethenteron reissneri]XP_061437858.1 uncharacterized protein LOC133362907 [Lethenteron reissneri]
MEPASLSDFLCSLIDLAASLRLPPHALHCARAAVSSLLGASGERARLSALVCSLLDVSCRSSPLTSASLRAAHTLVRDLATQAVAETPEVTASSPFNSDLCQGSGVTFKACCEDGLPCNPERGSRSHGFLGNLLKVLELAQRHPEATQTLHQLVSALLEGSIEPEAFKSRVTQEVKNHPEPYTLHFLKLSLPSIRQLLAERTYGRPTTAASPLTTPPPPISPRCVPKEQKRPAEEECLGAATQRDIKRLRKYTHCGEQHSTSTTSTTSTNNDSTTSTTNDYSTPSTNTNKTPPP